MRFMDSRQLPPQKIGQLRTWVAHRQKYLDRLCQRMESLKFPPDDALYLAARKARDALQNMLIETETILQPSWRKAMS
jgi:hypothetical protein